METKRMVLMMPEDIAAIIDANSTSKTKAVFVADCIRKALRNEKNGDGILERLALAVERAAAEMEKGGRG